MNASDRILQFIDYKQISGREFYAKCDISNGLFSKSKNIGSENLEKIRKAYPELNIMWVITGEGDMVVSDIYNNVPSPKSEESLMSQIIEELRASKEYAKENFIARIEFLEKEVNYLKDALSSEQKAHAETRVILGKP